MPIHSVHPSIDLTQSIHSIFLEFRGPWSPGPLVPARRRCHTCMRRGPVQRCEGAAERRWGAVARVCRRASRVGRGIADGGRRCGGGHAAANGDAVESWKESWRVGEDLLGCG